MLKKNVLVLTTEEDGYVLLVASDNHAYHLEMDCFNS